MTLEDAALAEVREILSGLPSDRLAIISSEPKERWPYLTLDTVGQYRLVDGIFSVDAGMRLLALCVRQGDHVVATALQSEARKLLDLQVGNAGGKASKGGK